MKNWWGIYELSENGSFTIQVGPLNLGIKNIGNEWQVYYDRDESWKDISHESKDESGDFALDNDTLKERYVLQGISKKVILSPALADRPFISQPTTPFYVPSRQSVIIYVSTPLWIKIGVGEEQTDLSEVPIMRPSDSWFGPNTIRGELCYASQTNARLSVNELPKRYHRAITPVEICNNTESRLLIERINLPVPYLELYEIAGKYLWTQGVRMTKKEEDESDFFEILKGPPKQAADISVYISEPREKTIPKNIFRTLSSRLFA